MDKNLRRALLEFVDDAAFTDCFEDEMVRRFAQRAFYYVEDGSASNAYVIPKRFADGRRA